MSENHILTRGSPPSDDRTPQISPDMPETAKPAEASPNTPPKRSPGHRGQDVRDTVAEMTAKAHEISLEAGSRMADRKAASSFTRERPRACLRSAAARPPLHRVVTMAANQL